MKLLVVAVAFAAVVGGTYWYGSFVRGLIEQGSWFWLSGCAVLPFVLGYIVGDEADRADYHRFGYWLMEKLQIR